MSDLNVSGTVNPDADVNSPGTSSGSDEEKGEPKTAEQLQAENEKLKEINQNLKIAVSSERSKRQASVAGLQSQINDLTQKIEVGPLADKEDDDTITVGELKAIQKAAEDKAAREKMMDDFQLSYVVAKAQYPDFDNVVTEDDIDRFEELARTNPDQARAMLAGTSPRQYASVVYNWKKSQLQQTSKETPSTGPVKEPTTGPKTSGVQSKPPVPKATPVTSQPKKVGDVIQTTDLNEARKLRDQGKQVQLVGFEEAIERDDKDDRPFGKRAYPGE